MPGMVHLLGGEKLLTLHVHLCTSARISHSDDGSGRLERECEKSSDAEEGKCHEIIPGELLFEIENRKYDEDRDRDHLLNYLELKSRKLDEAEPIGGTRQTIFERCDGPAAADCFPH